MKNIILAFIIVTLFGCSKIAPGTYVFPRIKKETIVPSPPTIVFKPLSYFGKTSYALKVPQQGFVNIDSLRTIFGVRNVGQYGGNGSLGFTYVDINNDGLEDIFYTIRTDIPYKKHRPQVFLKNKNGNYTYDGNASQLPDEYMGSYDCRKVIIGDFNNDSIPDILMANMGPDGVTDLSLQDGSALFISQKGNTKYKQVQLPAQIKDIAFHGMAAGDLNKDGNLDIVCVGMRWPRILYGKGDGTFNYVEWPQYDNHDYLSVEIVDVNKDGLNDIIMAGAEYKAFGPVKINKSVIFWNKNGVINSKDTTCLPMVDITANDYNNVMDIVCDDIDGDGINEIILDRTTGGQVPFNNPAYNGFQLAFYKATNNFKSFADATNTFIKTATYPYAEPNTGRWMAHMFLYNDDGILTLRGNITTSNILPYTKIWKQNKTTKLFE